jgi:hypothetical protein
MTHHRGSQVEVTILLCAQKFPQRRIDRSIDKKTMGLVELTINTSAEEIFALSDPLPD